MSPRIVLALALILGPLVAHCLLYGPSLWVAQWREVPVALAWHAPRYSWRSEWRSGRRPKPQSQQRAVSGTQEAPQLDERQAALMHGMSLALRDRLDQWNEHPLWLVIGSEFRLAALELLEQSDLILMSSACLVQAQRRAPDDSILRADSAAYAVQYGESLEASRDSPMDARIISLLKPQQTYTGQHQGLGDGRIWRHLAEAAEVLSLGPEKWPRSQLTWTALSRGVNSAPLLQVFKPGGGAGGLSSLDEVTKSAYAATLKRACREHPEQYLETPFEQRLAAAWQCMGIEPRAAQFLACRERGMAAHLVGIYCALHMELLDALALSAFNDQHFAEAADWLELTDQLVGVLSESVRSPAVYNYLQQKRATVLGLAPGIQKDPACPPDVAQRMAALITGNRPATPRVASRVSPLLIPAIYLDNIARSMLAVSAVSFLAALVGWAHLRWWWPATSTDSRTTTHPMGPLVVALAAVASTSALMAAIEFTNHGGEYQASAWYALARLFLFLTILASLLWLVIVGLSYESARLRSIAPRTVWLLGCLALAVLTRLMLRGAAAQGQPVNAYSQVQLWAFDPASQRLPTIVACTLGMLPSLLLIAFATLRWLRWRREGNPQPLFHPAFVVGVAVYLGLWMVVGPPGEKLLSSTGSATVRDPRWSPCIEAANSVNGVLLFSDWSQMGRAGRMSLDYAPGWNLLTVSLALRVMNLGLWLVVGCCLLWGLRWLIERARRSAAGPATAFEPASEPAQAWLRGVTSSCLSIGLAAMVLHAWCTLALGYCVAQVIRMP